MINFALTIAKLPGLELKRGMQLLKSTICWQFKKVNNPNFKNILKIQYNYYIDMLYIYYMDNGVLLETKTLVELIRHYIRGQVRVFSVFHPC